MNNALIAIAEHLSSDTARRALAEIETNVRLALPISSEQSGYDYLGARERSSRETLSDEALAEILGGTSRELIRLRSDIRSRSNASFVLLFAFGALSGILVLSTIGFVLAGLSTESVLAAVGTTLSGGSSFVFWKLYESEARRADVLLVDLQKIEMVRIEKVLSMASMRSTSNLLIQQGRLRGQESANQLARDADHPHGGAPSEC